MQEVAEPFRLLPPPTWVGKDTLSPASKVMPNPQWVLPQNWTISGSLTGGSPIQAATPGTPCSWSQSSAPVACHSRGITVFVSLLNNSSCFQPVLNPPGNLILQRRRVLLYVISRQQLWPRHPERRSLCRTVVTGVNFPSPPRHPFKGCWKRAVTLWAHTASSDFLWQLWGTCPFTLTAGYPRNLHNHLFYYFLFCLLRDWTSHLPTEGALVFCIWSSRLWQYYWKVTLSIFNIQKYRTAVLSRSPFV